jgi:hypothetical protein
MADVAGGLLDHVEHDPADADLAVVLERNLGVEIELGQNVPAHLGQRYAFNWALALVTAVMDQRNAEASYGISRTRS